MIGFNFIINCPGVLSAQDRAVSFSVFTNFAILFLLGLTITIPFFPGFPFNLVLVMLGYSFTWYPSSSNPSLISLISVLSSLKRRPLSFKKTSIRVLAFSTCSLVVARTVISSAYLTTNTPSSFITTFSTPSNTRLEIVGDITPPCGTPDSVSSQFPSYIIPHFSHPYRIFFGIGIWFRIHSWDIRS